MSELNNASLGSLIGIGQTWQAVTRNTGNAYTNTTGRPIILVQQCNLPTGGNINFTVNGVANINYVSNTGAATVALSSSVVVPVGGTYTPSGNTITAAAYELR